MLSIDLDDKSLARKTPNHPRLKVPTGIDQRQWNVKNSEGYRELYDLLHKYGKSNLTRESSYCFYCGSKTTNIVPAFIHNGSGNNLWMFNDWRTSYIICLDCMKHYGDNKVNYFGPIQDIPPERSNRLLSFLPEIVLPTIDTSHLHFEYESSGFLEPKTERASRTIERFSLNRRELIDRRRESIELSDTYAQFDRLTVPNDILFSLESFKKSHRESEIISFIKSNFSFYKSPFDSTIEKQLKTEIEKKRGMFKRTKIKRFSGIDRIEFSGVRDFKSNQEIKFNGKNNIIILGENGVGKSTLLEVVKRSLKKGSKKSLSDLCNDFDNQPKCNIIYSNEKYSLSYNEKGRFVGKKDECNLIYVSDYRTSPKYAKELSKWIQENAYEKELIFWIARRLSNLLSLPEDFYFCTNKDGVYWKTKTTSSGRFYLTDFSSGYNSILTIFYKIVSGITEKHTDNSLEDISRELSSTIVLVDEIELHLHPKFKKNIMNYLNDAFPEVIFIVTTHDPLILKSTTDGDLAFTIEKNDGVSSVNTDLPSHRYLTAEQILSSPIFGLGTIEETEHINDRNISKYYNAIRAKNWEKVNELRDILSHAGYFGRTYRELIALSAVDAYLSRGKKPDIESIVNILNEVDQDGKD
ncbi:AAA family ATPase [Vibrio chagasii]|uniref:AAA family ATPase n=1 Tax=Vibrio chagasii TaxID=170679 RepID=UPI00354E770C